MEMELLFNPKVLVQYFNVMEMELLFTLKSLVQYFNVIKKGTFIYTKITCPIFQFIMEMK